MKLSQAMQSNAGSTRKVRYLIATTAGLALSVLAILVSFWATYYSSPRMLSEKVFEVQVAGKANVTLPLAAATGKKLYYDLIVESSSSVALYLYVNTASGSHAIHLGEGLKVQREGTVYLNDSPKQLTLVLTCTECSVRGVLSVRYYSIDYSQLLVMNVVAVASSLIGIGLLTVGGYGYLIERRARG